MRMPAVVVLGLLLTATAADAAIEYEFQQTTQSEVEGIRGGQVSGKGVVDGTRSRIEFISGSQYPPGTYVIGLDGSKRLYIVIPSRKQYSEVDVTAIAVAYGGAFDKIENLRTNVQKLDDHPVIAGLPTDHFRLQTSYDLTVVFGGLPLKQSVNTVIDKWTTGAFGDVSETYLQNGGLRTGNAELDKLIEAETSKIKGFPLKQLTTITTSSGDLRSAKLQLKPVRRQVSELVITGIRTTTPDAQFFSVPAGYEKRATTQEDQSGVHILAMEPEH